jgi:hypothetical protein
MHRHWTIACGACAPKVHCTSGKERRISRWEHEDVLGRAQEREAPIVPKAHTRRPNHIAALLNCYKLLRVDDDQPLPFHNCYKATCALLGGHSLWHGESCDCAR